MSNAPTVVDHLDIRRPAAGLLAWFLATAALAAWGAFSLSSGLFTACDYDETEQGSSCIWSASTQGDGAGSSFLAIPTASDTLIISLPNSLAAHLT